MGAGYAGTYTFQKLHKKFHGDARVSLTLINRSNYFLSTPLLHEVATGSISPENIIEPLRKILRCTHEQFLLTDVKSISLLNKVVETFAGTVPYDYLVLAMGAETNYRGVPGARENTFTLKTLEDAIKLKNHFIEVFERATLVAEGDLDALLHFVIIGGGGVGVELAAEMADFFYETFATYYPAKIISRVKITIINSSDELLLNFQRSIRTRSKQVLRQKGIEVRFGLQVTKIEPGKIYLNNNQVVKTGTIIWAAGVKPSSVPIDVVADLEKIDGRLVVNEYLQIPSFPNVFVLGDMAAFKNPGEPLPVPMLAQVAHRQSVGVARNVINLIEGWPVVPYVYRHFGDLVSLGNWMAAGELFGFKFFGHLAWFFWRGVYLSKLLSPAKQAKVLLDWFINLFLPRDISEL